MYASLMWMSAVVVVVVLLTQMLGCHLVDGAEPWVQQEQPGKVSELLIQFLQQLKR